VIFLDSAHLDDARQAARLPFVGGLSMNPSLLAAALGVHAISRETFRTHLAALAEAISGTLFVQTVSHHTDAILADAAEILELVDPTRVVIKIPYSDEGLRATERLEADGVSTCTTSIFTPLQAYVAATSGAAWIAPYCNRITRAGGDGVAAVRAMRESLALHGLPCRLLVASVKSLEEMERVVAAGAHHVTVPLDLVLQAARHPASDEASARFQEDLRWDQQQRETSS
jgi:TalC/MipB family fructose-6-phosphate aldolase